MYLNDFSVRVPQGHEISGGYVELDHATQYSIRLRNARSVRCNAYVEVDGKHVGTWRLHPGQSMEIERPAHDTGKFTFYKVGSVGAFRSQAHLIHAEKRGLVSVTYTPELVTEVRPLEDEALRKSNFHYYYTPTSGSSGSFSIDEPVTFSSGDTDEPNTYRSSHTAGVSDGIACAAAAPGVTGLSGQSNQQFVEAPDMAMDFSQTTVINLRLVCGDTDTPRPLTQFSTPVPPVVK